ncbi:GAF domain-containing protein, partial [bacterium]|nr:GAF domain-containing protein [bacterium]
GKTIQEFWVSTEYEHLWSDIRAGKTWAGEMQCSRAYGCLFAVEILVRPIVTESRSFHAYVCVQRDITKRKAMEKQLAEYSHNLEERVKQRTESLAKLHDISQLFHSAETLEKRLHLILIATTAGEAFGFNRAFLLLYHEDSHSLVGQMAIGPSSPEEAGHIWRNVAEIPDDGTFMGRMKSYLDHAGRMDENANRIARQMYIPLSDTFSILAQSIELDRSFIVNHGQTEVEYDRSIMELLGTDTFAVIPLIARETKVGALVVDNIITQKSIEPEDLQMVDILANQAALAIAHANTLDELARKVEETEYAYSELRRSQEKLIESSKFAALGQMAATVAHEIRTPLVTIGGFANLLKSQMEGYREPENLHYIDIIREEAFRLEDVLNQLLFYARPSRPKLAYHDLHAFIDSILNFLKKEFSKNQIQLVRQYDSQLPRVPFDSNLLRQVIINIVQNGIQSMLKDGKLFVSTLREDASFVIWIQDEGAGIAEDHLSKIFEPFYSTKHAGTGLGLHVSKRIVESHNGSLTIESQIGVGTSIGIRLPIQETRIDEKNSSH